MHNDNNNDKSIEYDAVFEKDLDSDYNNSEIENISMNADSNNQRDQASNQKSE